MKKVLIRTLLLVFVTLVVGVGIFLSSLSSIVSSNMTKTLGVPVHIGAIHIGWNSVTIKDMVIENLEGSEVTPAFSSNTITVRIQPLDLLGDEPTVDEVVVAGPTMGLEVYDRSGNDHNWKRILDGVPPAPKNDTSKTYVIKRVLITDTQLVAKVPAISPSIIRPDPLEPIELKNVGKDNPAALKEIARVIIRALTKESMFFLNQLPVNPGKIIKDVLPGGDKSLIPGGDKEKGGLLKGIFGK